MTLKKIREIKTLIALDEVAKAYRLWKHYTKELKDEDAKVQVINKLFNDVLDIDKDDIRVKSIPKKDYSIAELIEAGLYDVAFKRHIIKDEYDTVIQMLLKIFNSYYEPFYKYSKEMFEQGYTYLKNGEYEEAIKAFKESQKSNPNAPQTLECLGRIYFAQGRYSEAAIYYENYLALNQLTDYYALLHLLVCYIYLNDEKNYQRIGNIIKNEPQKLPTDYQTFFYFIINDVYYDLYILRDLVKICEFHELLKMLGFDTSRNSLNAAYAYEQTMDFSKALENIRVYLDSEEIIKRKDIAQYLEVYYEDMLAFLLVDTTFDEIIESKNYEIMIDDVIMSYNPLASLDSFNLSPEEQQFVFLMVIRKARTMSLDASTNFLISYSHLKEKLNNTRQSN